MNYMKEENGKRTNREVLNTMSNEQFAKFMDHIDCSCCAYYSEDPEQDYVCTKQDEGWNDPEAASHICIEGFAKWLSQEEAWWLRE